MNLLHRYLMRELLAATLGAVGLFTFVLFTGNAIKDVVTRLANGVLPLPAALEMLAMIVPFALPYALPMGLLTAILLTLGRASAQHEITAMRTAGLGIGRIAAPALLLAVLGVAVCLVINFEFAPNAKTAYRRILAEAGQRSPLSVIVERQFVREFRGYVVYVSEKDGETLRDVWLWIMGDGGRVKQFVRAESGVVRWDEQTNILSLRMRQAQVQNNPDDATRPPLVTWAETVVYDVPLEDLFKKAVFERKPSWLDFGELIEEKRRLAHATTQADRDRLMQVELNLHEKAALSFSVLSFVLVGVPLGIRTGRKETSANLGVALLLVMIYYGMLMAAGWLDRYPQYHPELLLWVPNIIFQALAVVLWRRFGRNQ